MATIEIDAEWQWDNTDSFASNVPNENPSNQGVFKFNQRFPGQYYDKETNLAYNVNRDYDPGAGRYLEFDPIGLTAGVNGYTYVENNPLSLIDPDGSMGHAPGKGPYAPGTGPSISIPQAAQNAWNGINSLSCSKKCNFTVGLICGPLAGIASETGPGAVAAYAACRLQVLASCNAVCGIIKNDSACSSSSSK